MNDEEKTYYEIREDRRLIELGLNPDENPVTLGRKLKDKLKEWETKQEEFELARRQRGQARAADDATA